MGGKGSHQLEDIRMTDKPTYEELEHRVKELEKDAVERGHVETALRESEATLKSIFRAAPAGIGMVRDRIINQANDRLCEMLGYSTETLLGKSARILYPTDDDFEYVGREKYNQIRKKGTGTVETRWQRQDGEIIDVLLSSTPIDTRDLSAGVTFTALDITRRKQVEKALKEHEALLKKSQEMAHVGSWRLDLRKNDLYWTDEVYRIFGLTPQEFEATYEAFLKTVHPDDRDMVDDTYKDAIKNHKPYDLIHRVVRPDGTIRTVREKSEDIMDESGNVVLSVGMVHDITERVQAEEALRDSERKYATLVENSKDGIIMISDGVLKFVNRASIELVGRSPDEMIGANFLDFIAADYRDLVLKRYTDRISGKDVPPIYEIGLLRRDGSTIPVELNAIRIDFEDKPADLVVIRDITERKQNEEALKESEKRFRETVELLPSIICEYDLDGRMTYVNNYGLKTFGYTHSDVEQGLYADQMVPPDELAKFKDRFSSLVKGNKTDPIEYRLRCKDGSKIYVIANSAPIFKDGRIVGSRSSITPITERKEFEELLRKSEKRYRLLADNVLDVIWTRDINLGLTYISPSVTDQLGYTVEEAKALTLEESWTPDSFNRIKEVLTEELEVERKEKTDLSRSRMVEVEAKCKDGSTKWVEAKMNFLRDQNGQPVGVIGVTRDISERKRTEAALKESEEKYRDLVRYAPTGIYEIDYRKGKLSSVNDVMSEISGYTREELLSMNPIDLLSEDSKKLYIKRLKKLFAGEQVPDKVEFKIKRKDGKELWALLNVKFVYENGNVKRATVVAHDINDRKRAEEALKESEEKYRTVLEANPDPVIVYDIEGKVLYFNPAFTRVFGWTLEERLGQKMDLFVPEDAWPETQKMIQKVLAGERFSGVETRRYTKEGNMIPVSISGAIYKDQGGTPLGSVINLRDISEQKKLEAQLHQAQKMEAIGTLAGGITHDFNNLLMGIQGRTSLMLMGMDPSHPHTEHLKGIENYVISAADLTKQLLGFARSGKYEVKTIDLNDLVKRENKMFGRTKKEVNILEKFQKDLWSIDADQGQIEQVLLNIHVNAWQAMPGGGNLYVQTENVIIDEDFSKPHHVEPGKYVKISITDTGVGMDEATQQRIFDPFFTTKEMGRGTGLGLASSYGIIKNHGGFIDVYSVKGEGATFNIYLPASEKTVVKEKTFHKEIFRGTETVLLVDDEEIITRVGKEMLSTLGYNALIAKSGKEAIQTYKENQEQIDIVILDMILPEMGGGEIYDALKEINPDMKVILSSGYSIDGKATEIMERGCDGFLQKPFKIGELSRKLREVLTKK